MPDPLVNFLVIGAQKAGTTALFEYLREHPEVQVPTIKEVHYFDDETRDWACADHGDYHRHFDAGDPRVARGEVTPIYIYWPPSLARIHAYNPAMRLILVLRDPVTRAWSHWRMERARGAETEAFSWCIREGRARLADTVPPGVHREFSYVERGFYGEQIGRLLGRFPREQLLVLQSTELDQDPNAVMARVSAFLGTAPPPSVPRRRVHVGEANGDALLPEDAAYLRSLYREDDAKLRALTGISFAGPA